MFLNKCGFLKKRTMAFKMFFFFIIYAKNIFIKVVVGFLHSKSLMDVSKTDQYRNKKPILIN